MIAELDGFVKGSPQGETTEKLSVFPDANADQAFQNRLLTLDL